MSLSSTAVRKALLLIATASAFAEGAVAEDREKPAEVNFQQIVLKAKPSTIPEPGTLVMIGGGLFTLFGIQRMRNRTPR